MKLKLSFDKHAIVNFFIDHAEKVIFALFILLFVTIIYGAVMKRDKFDKTPQQLSQECSDAQQKLAGSRNIGDLPTTDYNKKARELSNKTTIDESSYQCECAWRPQLFEQKEPRKQPALFAVKELRATAELGAFKGNVITVERTMEPVAGAGERSLRPGMPPPTRGGAPGDTQGKSWVVITGLVPYEAQINAYKEAFRDSILYDPANDFPLYKGYWVERAEINSPADLQNPQWTKKFFSADAEDEALKEWMQPQMDVVEDKYVDAALTFPLGPLSNRAWGRNVAHEPEIPFVSSTAETAEGGYGRGGTVDARTMRTMTGANPRDAYRPGMRPLTRNTMTNNPDEITIAAEKPPMYKLFRFFDFTAQPGKSYIYRVRLVLNNPNYGLKPSQLEKADYAKNETLETNEKDSETTKVVYVPKDTHVLVNAIDDSKPTSSPSYEVLLVKWVRDTGKEVYKDFSVDRGQVLNYNDQEATLVGGPGISEGEDKEKTDMNSDATVLDLAGGGRLSGKDRKLTEPRDILLMVMKNNSPVLVVRNELDDMSEVTRVTAKPEGTGYDRMAPPGTRFTPGRNRDTETLLRGGGREENPPPRVPPRRP